MIENLAVLQRKTADLGLTVTQSAKRAAKDDYIRVLRAHYMPEGGLPYVEVTPMLCFPSWDLPKEELEKAWFSNKWIAQEKLNGCRLIVHAVKGKGWFAHSRTVSLKTYRFEEHTGSLLFAEEAPPFNATVDCEVIISKEVDTSQYTKGKGAKTKSSLHSTTAVLHLEDGASKRLQREQDAPLIFQVFDILRWQGTDIKLLPLKERLQILNQFFRPELADLDYGREYFRFPEYRLEKKKEFHQEVIDRGGEGTILKHLDCHYEASSSRKREGWLKIKKRREYDAFVTGFIRGEKGSAWENMVGSLQFSVNTEKGEHVIGYASNITLETRARISVYDASMDDVKLLPAIYNKVAEISGQDISGRALRLSHCTIDKWRSKNGPDGKRAEDCETSYADLEEAARWVS